MSPQWLHVPQTEILQLSHSPFVPRALLVHLLGNSGIKYHPTNTAYFHSKPGKWASIWTRIKGRIQFLSLAKDFLVAVIFICCEILHISRVTPCHPSTERNTAHPSWKARWNTKIWSPKMTLLRKQKPSKGHNSIMGGVGGISPCNQGHFSSTNL